MTKNQQLTYVVSQYRVVLSVAQFYSSFLHFYVVIISYYFLDGFNEKVFSKVDGKGYGFEKDRDEKKKAVCIVYPP